MDIHITRHIGAVTRQVEDGEREGRPTRKVRADRTYDTTVEDLWSALTDPARIPRWFLPIGGDLRLGGRYQLEGNAGGEITACEPPDHLALTWEFGEQLSWVEVRLSPHADDPDGRTRLQLEHTAPVDEHWDEFGPGAVGIGWELSLLGLALHLESGAGVEPALVAAWVGTEEAKEFMRRSSDGWRRADVDAGTPEPQARAAAERTTQAYTAGEDP
ncbi:MAG: SRPBCC family protein [Acidimicrobiales bacterium]|nr:SRPBCC family protein [Acidimicrobiales bacterium]